MRGGQARRVLVPGNDLTSSEDGLTLVEMTVALLVLLVVFLATAELVFASLATSTDNSNKEVAESIATGVLSQEREAAFNESSKWFTESGLPTAADPVSPYANDANWCNTSCNPIVQVVASESYYVYLTGGWCEETTLGSWGNTSSSGTAFGNTVPYPGYFIAIKVAWGPGSDQTTSGGVTGINSESQVVMQGLITTAGGDYASAPTSGPIESCPVGNLS
jgi:type II secretory pathway pseudopilin PulG